VKWLRFCYGENAEFEENLGIPAALSCLFHLQLDCEDVVKDKIVQHMLRVAKKDPVTGAKMLVISAVEYAEKTPENKLNAFRESLAKIVFTLKNMTKEEVAVVDECLMKLPASYLDYVEYGEEHSTLSEFNLRTKYAREHQKSFKEEERKQLVQQIVSKCDRTKCNNAELRSLDELNQIEGVKEMLDLHQALERKMDAAQKLLDDSQKEMEKWEALGKEGDPEAMVKLAFCYQHGIGTKQDTGKAVKLYADAARCGSAYAAFCLAKCLDTGAESQEEKERAYKNWKEAADMGNSDAMVHLGYCLENGYGVAQNLGDAFERYESAGKLDNAEGKYHEGRCYENGIGVDKNLDKAVECYEKAAERNSNAMVSLGLAVEKSDRDRAKSLFSAAAEMNNAAGLYHLGRCFANGIGVPQDLKSAAECYDKSSKLGNDCAMYSLGRFYEKGLGGVDKNLTTAISLYRQGTEKGNADAMNALGKHYELGCSERGHVVLDTDKSKAIDLYKRASERDNAAAMVNLAMCYVNGYYSPTPTVTEEVKQPTESENKEENQEEAAPAPAATAAAAGDEGAAAADQQQQPQEPPPELSEEEKKKAEEEAARKAAEEEAARKAAQEAEAKKREEEKQAEIFNLFKRAAELGNDEAMFQLAICYEAAFGTPSNSDSLNEAKKYYRAAANNGNTEAMYVLGQQLYGHEKAEEREEGIALLKRAVERGHKKAEEFVSSHYIK